MNTVESYKFYIEHGRNTDPFKSVSLLKVAESLAARQGSKIEVAYPVISQLFKDTYNISLQTFVDTCEKSERSRDDRLKMEENLRNCAVYIKASENAY